MPRSCTICTHEMRCEIDEALVSGSPYRDIALRHDVSHMAVSRHKEGHLPAKLLMSEKAKEVAEADAHMDRLNLLTEDARRIGGKAEQAGDLRTALAGIRELVRIAELQAKLAGELNEGMQISLNLSPEWLEVKAAIIVALGPYAGARDAVVRALDGVGNG